jgi:hypothetical protein
MDGVFPSSPALPGAPVKRHVPALTVANRSTPVAHTPS